ncbi:TlpA family protein disulfide reductase [Arcicella rigui]|uniref:TlpA disulfide reductase family protein n=1 Tax=Arcicella rigui TaxID=797020 RepID=A0ABU5QDM7_9BACT|nr:TlpA disulfide reductase family protein [Arcicella rigui]MEA5140747.1 TlpA disulfide reductase family protein [Arcicella rigui]
MCSTASPFRLALFVLMYFCTTITPSFSQDKKIEVVKFEHLQKNLNRLSDTTYVVHFWATWCRSCIEEMPTFEQLRKEYSTKKMKFLFVSLDFPSDIANKVKPYLIKNNINTQVLLLDEPDYNAWIDLVDKEWSGTIPATLLLNTTMRKRKFFTGNVKLQEFTEELKMMCPVTIQN